MKKWLLITFALLAVIILVIVTWTRLQPPEPVYGGQPISYWIERRDVPPTMFSMFEAPTDFPALDSNAIPYLVRALQRRKSGPTTAYVLLWRIFPARLQRNFKTPHDPNVIMIRASAALELGRIGTNSPAALDGLLRALKRDDNSIVRQYAAESLQQIGKGNETVTRALVEALSDPAPEVRDAAMDALWQLDPAVAKARRR